MTHLKELSHKKDLVFFEGNWFEVSEGVIAEPPRVAPHFVIYPPGASDEVRKSVDELIKSTWGPAAQEVSQ